MTVAERQMAMAPKDDLRPYAGQWVALRDGHVVASDIDPVALRDRAEVQSSDTLLPVPVDGEGLFIL